MARFDLLYEREFSSTDTIVLTHGLNRYIYNVRLIITGDPRLSQRELVKDVQLDPTAPLDKCVVLLTGTYTGTVQIVAEDTIQSPYYTVAEKLASQEETDLAGTYPVLAQYGGTSGNKWLDYTASDSSDDAPYIVIDSGFIKGLALGSTSASTGTVTLYVNAVATVTISLSNDTQHVDLVDIEVQALDEISWKITGGTLSKPYLTTYLKTI